VEGRVVVRVLVDKDGSAKRMFIDASDNELLNDAAITAIKKYGKFTPAIQNDQPIMVWLSIPIQFKLR
ncbi:MAG: energy transducer TonB, partial [Chloroherpetonaceae bacterium]